MATLNESNINKKRKQFNQSGMGLNNNTKNIFQSNAMMTSPTASSRNEASKN